MEKLILIYFKVFAPYLTVLDPSVESWLIINIDNNLLQAAEILMIIQSQNYLVFCVFNF